MDTISNQIANSNGLQIRNPNNLVVVTEALLKAHPDFREVLAPYHDLRAERGQGGEFEVFKAQVASIGRILDPVKIAKVESIGDVVVDGRQRVRAAIALGLASVPVIFEDGSHKNVIQVEMASNLARSENTIVENAHLFKKAMLEGLTVDDIATQAGVSPTTIKNTILIGEMPKEIHKMIYKGEISQTAALSLQTYGKKAPKGSGAVRIYDEEAKKAMLEAVSNMDAEAKLKGGGKRISVKQARQSASKPVESLTGKNWDALVADESTPIEYALLIQVFRGKLNWQQARQQRPEQLGWLKKVEPAPKPKAEKKPKKEKAPVDESVTNPSPVEVGSLDFLQ